MKVLENIVVKNDVGKIVSDPGTQKPIDTLACVKSVLNNVEYKTRTEQRYADKVYDKLNLKDGKIELEDSEFELIQNHILSYKPFLNGRMFSPILAQFEE